MPASAPIITRSICDIVLERLRPCRRRYCRTQASALIFCAVKALLPPKKVSPPQLTQAERCAKAYEQYLAEARALAKATMLNYVPLIRGFLKDRFGEGPVMLSRLTASGRRGICSASSAAFASEARKAANHRVAFFPALRALSRRSDTGFGCRGSHCGQLVDAVDSSRR